MRGIANCKLQIANCKLNVREHASAECETAPPRDSAVDGSGSQFAICNLQFAICNPPPERWPKIWRLVIIGLGVLILCSCQGPAGKYDTSAIHECANRSPSPQPYASLPLEAYTGVPAAPAPPMGPPGMERGVPLPYHAMGPWKPPGIGCPWPQEEYLCDGGEKGPPVWVGSQYEVHGLQMEDAVAHFDTLDGRTVVQPTNRVCLYAPRFGAVRQVLNPKIDQQEEQALGMYQPEKLYAPRESTPVVNAKQHYAAGDEIGRVPAEALRTRWTDGVLSDRIKAMAFVNKYLPYENVTAIRTGMMLESEAAFLARGSTAAVAWSNAQCAQVLLNRKVAVTETGATKPEVTYTLSASPAPRLRVIKVASTPFAEPGDEVAFTIRFDNVGNQPIGNVTILDSLSTRLEYLPNSAQCSRDAQFSTRANEGDSVVVRCELTDPLKPGQGGVLRFKCRVR